MAARVQYHQGRAGPRERWPHRPADRSGLQGRQGSRHQLHAAALQGQQHSRNHAARSDGGLCRFWRPPTCLAGSLGEGRQHPEVFEKTFMQNLTDFVTWQVPNRFVIRYRGKELKHHSRAARFGAVAVRAQSTPERRDHHRPTGRRSGQPDHLRRCDQAATGNEASRPFIFATHNANFPVLGDAEQVHACQYQDEKVATRSGSIDARPVQDAIINIMEGGQEAFNRRKEVYNLWKPQS